MPHDFVPCPVPDCGGAVSGVKRETFKGSRMQRTYWVCSADDSHLWHFDGQPVYRIVDVAKVIGENE